MLIRYKCKEGQDHIKVVPLIAVTSAAKALTMTRTQISLLPGTNEVSDDEWEVMKPHIKDEIEKGIIIEVQKNAPADGKKGGKGKSQAARELKDMSVKVAKSFVADCVNPDSLAKWYKEETRDEVRLAIIKKMEEIKMDIPNSKLEGDETDLENDKETGEGGGDSGAGGGGTGGE